ncbi:tRNA/rRNA methyltransferase [candidate division KSB1 bacterium]|nr:tRNA/rRNA methyltransferase [candidate division KSB1 bacterium]
MQFYFILVSPQRPENIGAAARAMNTMGFDNMRLVNAGDFLGDRALELAHGSDHILKNAAIFESFEAAIADLDFVIGATARRRKGRQEYFSGEELPPLLASKKASIHNVGIVFGREDRGLLNEQINRCDALVALTMRAAYPSLNLAQAVMVFAYILSPFVLQPAKALPTPPATAEFLSLKKRIRTLFIDIGLDNNPNIFDRLLEKMAHLSQEDVHLLHSLCSRLEKILQSQNDAH